MDIETMDDSKRESLENTEPWALSIAVASTFVAEPIEASIRFWMQELGIATKIAFAPFNQVFQQLLDPASLLAINHNGVNPSELEIYDIPGGYTTMVGNDHLGGDRNVFH